MFPAVAAKTLEDGDMLSKFKVFWIDVIPPDLKPCVLQLSCMFAVLRLNLHDSFLEVLPKIYQFHLDFLLLEIFPELF